MKVLIIGSGGREHAIAWSAVKSPRVEKVYCAPGNGGIAGIAQCVPIGAMEFERLAEFASEQEIDLTIVGMDDPLVGGIVDVFEQKKLRIFGPRKNAAILEGSKAFSKDLMKKYHIPTAAYENFTDSAAALAYLQTAKFPIVLKADGLALGKGVLICNTLEEAQAGVQSIMEDKQFGSAGNCMVIEEYMTGREVSVLSFVDGRTIRTMTSAQDHKRAFDGDEGPNTGGLLYKRGGCVLSAAHLSEDGGCDGGGRTRIQGHNFLWADADRGWAQGIGIQRPVRRPGGAGGAAADEKRSD